AEHVVQGFTGAIGLALEPASNGGTLSGGDPVNAVNGIVTFANLSINKAGTGYTLRATAPPLTDATSSAFAVTAPPSGSLRVTTNHTVALTDVPGNCTVTGGASKTVPVTAGRTATAAFTVTCTALPPPTGDLTVTAATSGQDLDPDGYTVTVDGGQSRSLGINTSTTYNGLTATSHTVELTGIAGNCTVSAQNPRTVTVATSGTTTTFTITCAALPP